MAACDIVDIVDLVSAIRAPSKPSVRPRKVVDCVELAISACAPRRMYKQRSWEHAKHARMSRKLGQANMVKLKVTNKANDQITAYNTSLAVRPGDQIVVGKVPPRHPLARGRGGYRRWLPEALLRCCFGRSVKKVERGKPQPRSGLHIAPRTVAEWFRGGHAHVQRVRNAVAEIICDEVKKRMKEVGNASSVILEVSFDETKEIEPLPPNVCYEPPHKAPK